MKKKKLQQTIFFLLSAYFLISYGAYSQSDKVNFSKVKKLSRQGKMYLRKENYHQAIEFYERVLALDSNHVRALLYAGICKMHLHDNAKSLSYLQKAYELAPEINPFIHFLLGRAYHINMQFDLASIHYDRYYKTLNWLSGDKAEVALLISQASVGKKYVLEPTDVYAENLGVGVNSSYSDHSAVLTGNRESIVFTSTRTDKLSSKDVRKTGDAYEHTYTARRFFDGSWGKPELFTPLGITARAAKHVANSMLFNNDKNLILYNSDKSGSLLFTEKTENGWSKPKPLSKFTHTQQYESNACFSKDGRVFYFASSRGSRRGDLDLFYCRLKPDSTWSDPVAMPVYVNSTEDEDAPFISDDGLTLFFSSKGHENLGGFDIFKTTFNTTAGLWSKPVNLGYPTNTPEDDIYFFTNDSTHISYMSSNRAGGFGEEDIFNLRPLEEVMIRGLVTTPAEVALPGIDIVFVSQKNKDLGVVTISGPNGVFGTRLRCRHLYKVMVYQNGKLIRTEELNIPLTNRENQLLIKDFQLNVTAAQSSKPAPRLDINNRNLIKISYQEFDTLEIDGVVRDEKTALGQAQVRIRKEAAARYEASTVTDANGHYRLAFVPGKRENYVIEILKPGYPMQNIAIVYVERNFQKIAEETREKNVNVISLQTQLTKAEPGKSFVLGGLYFENKSDGWKKEGEVVLDQLVTLLEETPGLVIEVGAYTDSKGNLGENRIFAQRWSTLVVNYLIEKGIDQKRLMAKSYGESNPLAPNDTELNGRDVNRRIVVKVLESKVEDKR
jgi:outer membrane protein OmpA-like peptidoglycan-associated protein/tetratricopeptide (TPR) repeat protein